MLLWRELKENLKKRGYHQKTRDEILRQSRGRARDPRVIAILEKHPDMTFKEWLAWQIRMLIRKVSMMLCINTKT